MRVGGAQGAVSRASRSGPRLDGQERRPAWRWAGLDCWPSRAAVKPEFGVMATAYPKCQHLCVGLRQTKPCSREQGRGWEWRWGSQRDHSSFPAHTSVGEGRVGLSQEKGSRQTCSTG